MINVRKQQRTFRNAPIGTMRFVNVDTVKNQSIINAVDNVNKNILLPEVDKAMRKSTAKKLMRPVSEFLAVDPETGLPVLLGKEYTGGMGANQLELYTESVRKNHFFAIEKDIQRKVAEYKSFYKTKPHGTAQYRQATTDLAEKYIDKLFKGFVGDSEYKNFAYESAVQQIADGEMVLREQRAVAQQALVNEESKNRIENDLDINQTKFNQTGERSNFISLRVDAEALSDPNDKAKVIKQINTAEANELRITINRQLQNNDEQLKLFRKFLTQSGPPLSKLKELLPKETAQLLDEYNKLPLDMEGERRKFDVANALLLSKSANERQKIINEEAIAQRERDKQFFDAHNNADNENDLEALFPERYERFIDVARVTKDLSLMDDIVASEQLPLVQNLFDNQITKDQFIKEYEGNSEYVLKVYDKANIENQSYLSSWITNRRSGINENIEATIKQKTFVRNLEKYNKKTFTLLDLGKDLGEAQKGLNPIQPFILDYYSLPDNQKKLMLENLQRNGLFSENNLDLLKSFAKNPLSVDIKTANAITNFLIEYDKLPTILKQRGGGFKVQASQTFNRDNVGFEPLEREKLEAIIEISSMIGTISEGDLTNLAMYNQGDNVEKIQMIIGSESKTASVDFVKGIIDGLDIVKDDLHKGSIANEYDDFTEIMAYLLVNRNIDPTTGNEISLDEKKEMLINAVTNKISRDYLKPHKWQTDMINSEKIRGSLLAFEGTEQLTNFENKMELELGFALRKSGKPYSFDPSKEINPSAYEQAKLITISPKGKTPFYLAVDEDNEVIMFTPQTNLPPELIGQQVPEFLAWTLDEVYDPAEISTGLDDLLTYDPKITDKEAKKLIEESQEEINAQQLEVDLITEEMKEGSKLSAGSRLSTKERREKINILKEGSAPNLNTSTIDKNGNITQSDSSEKIYLTPFEAGKKFLKSIPSPTDAVRQYLKELQTKEKKEPVKKEPVNKQSIQKEKEIIKKLIKDGYEENYIKRNIYLKNNKWFFTPDPNNTNIEIEIKLD